MLKNVFVDFFFFQAEDGIRDYKVTGVQTCALPIYCGGGLAERKSRFGKSFFGCVNYPNCKFAAWDRPIPGPCPQCGKPYLLQKYTKRDGAFIACPDKECGYRREAPEPGSENTQSQAS